MRTQLSKDFQTVLENFKKGFYNGICSAIYASMLPAKREREVRGFFLNNKPTETLHKEFYNHSCYTGGDFWWRGSKSSTEVDQRILFLEKMIEISNIHWYDKYIKWLKIK